MSAERDFATKPYLIHAFAATGDDGSPSWKYIYHSRGLQFILPEKVFNRYDLDDRRWLQVWHGITNGNRCFHVVNLPAAMGKYALPAPFGGPGTYYKRDVHAGYFTPLGKPDVYDEQITGNYQGTTYPIVGEIRVRFHPPIEHELREMAAHIFNQDVPVIDAVAGLIKQQRKITHRINLALGDIAEGMGAIALSNANASAVLTANAAKLKTAADAINCADSECWSNADYLQDVLTVWDAAHANLLAQEQAQLDRGEFPDDLNWRDALHKAIEDTDIHYPSVHHDYHLSDDTSLAAFTLSWARLSSSGAANLVENETREYVLILSDTVHDADIPSAITEFTLTATPSDSAATVYVNGTMERLPVDVTAPTSAYETSILVDVVAQNHIARATHTIILRRPDWPTGLASASVTVDGTDYSADMTLPTIHISVPATTTEITLDVVTNDPQATVSVVGGNTRTLGSGHNLHVFHVQVFANGGQSSATHLVTVTREQ